MFRLPCPYFFELRDRRIAETFAAALANELLAGQ
jgi:hypothetical protein